MVFTVPFKSCVGVNQQLATDTKLNQTSSLLNALVHKTYAHAVLFVVVFFYSAVGLASGLVKANTLISVVGFSLLRPSFTEFVGSSLLIRWIEWGRERSRGIQIFRGGTGTQIRRESFLSHFPELPSKYIGGILCLPWSLPEDGRNSGLFSSFLI